MRINQIISELTSIKNTNLYKLKNTVKDTEVTPKNNIIHFKDELEKINWKLIGEGAYATVYSHPDYPYVIKIFNQNRNFLKYFMWAKQNQNNKHLPKIKGKFIKIDYDTYAVRIEKLTPIKDQNILTPYIDPNLVYKFHEKLRGNYFNNTKPIAKFTTILNREYLTQNYPDIAEILNYIDQNFDLLHVDLHIDNIMLRNNTIVISDPVS